MTRTDPAPIEASSLNVKSKTMKYLYVRNITPEVAAKWLATSGGNRPTRPAHVTKIAKRIITGAWNNFSPEAFCFNSEGKLIEAHHRCKAIIKAEEPIKGAWIAVGCPLDTTEAIDDGAVRSLADRLFAYTDDRKVKKIVANRKDKAIHLAAMSGGGSGIYNVLTGEKAPPFSEAMEIIREYNDPLSFVVNEALSGNKESVQMMRRAAVGTAFVLAHAHIENIEEVEANKEIIEEFFIKVRDGVMLKSKDPAFLLRSYLLSIPRKGRPKNDGKRQRGSTDSQWVIFIKTLRAIKAEIEGEQLTRLAVPAKSRDLIEWFIGDTEEVADSLNLTSYKNLSKRKDNEED